MEAPRELLYRTSGTMSAVRVYRTRAGLEVDTFEGGEMLRRRLLWDDVLLVTYHTSLGWGFLVAVGLGAIVPGAVFVSLAREPGAAAPALGFLAVTGLPFLVAFVLRLVRRAHTVTVFGRRTKATLPFGIRKGRAREAFEHLARLAAEEQAGRAEAGS